MKVCVQGLWHLGAVTAACVAEAGCETVGLDPEAKTIANLKDGRPPLFEPGLAELVAGGIEAGNLGFTTDTAAALKGAQIVWVAFDTPVDEEDRADVDFVMNQVRSLFPHLEDGAAVLISSQVPVGSTRRLADEFAAVAGGRTVDFAYSPENLRLGAAIGVFKQPERIVVGATSPHALVTLDPLLSKFCDKVLWISVESAEMTKHALNAFLATSITFINEVASVCERVGADAGEVEAALKSEGRIGRKAYVRAGPAFAGGTLARDVRFLTGMGADLGLELPMLGGVIPSNTAHRNWALRRLEEKLGSLKGKRIGVLGLAYKPGTDAVRRSVAVELAQKLLAAGAIVQICDPAVKTLPASLSGASLSANIADAVVGAEALVVATEWSEFKAVAPDALSGMKRKLILDQSRFVEKALGADSAIEYLTIGRG